MVLHFFLFFFEKIGVYLIHHSYKGSSGRSWVRIQSEDISRQVWVGRPGHVFNLGLKHVKLFPWSSWILLKSILHQPLFSLIINASLFFLVKMSIVGVQIVWILSIYIWIRQGLRSVCTRVQIFSLISWYPTWIRILKVRFIQDRYSFICYLTHNLIQQRTCPYPIPFYTPCTCYTFS